MVSSDTSIVFKYFRNKVLLLDNFVITGEALDLEIKQLFEKLQQSNLKEEDILSKSSLKLVDEMYENIIISDEDIEELYRNLLNGTQKRNVGDNFKHIVTDNWKVDLVMTINLRSLKNFFELRDSGAAYFQIRNLAKAMKASTPSKYLDLIVKKKG
jgi:thymidylate synthase (FAD)